MEWRSIKGYEGLYEVSDSGQVRSVDRITTGNRQRKIRGRILKQGLSTTGYCICFLSKEGMQKTKKVHRLVAEAFLEKEEGKNIINHKDLNPKNNDASNLEWCTQSYNIRHCIQKGRHIGVTPKISAEEIEQMRREYKPYSRDRNYRTIAAKYGVPESIAYYHMNRRNYL